jgi:hypothetical protein
MRPFIFLTVDSLRADCANPDLLGESLSVLKRDYAKFTNAISYGVATPFAFPGIIAGTHPVDNGIIPSEATTIAEGIPGPSAAFTNNGHLRAERGYKRGFDRFEESPSMSTEENEDRSLHHRIIERIKQIETLQKSKTANLVYSRLFSNPLPTPTCPAPDMAQIVREELRESPEGVCWGHWMDPHTPYHPETAIDPPQNLPTYDELEDLDDRIVSADADDLTADEIELAQLLYEANVRYFDHHFSDLLNWLADQPWYDDAFIIVVSDHGEFFGEHGYMFHTWDIDPHNEAIETPLWVKFPDGADSGKTFDHLVGHGDILATLDNLFDETTIDPPAHTASLRDEYGRHVVSVSNTAKRLTEPDGVFFKRRDGSENRRGSISRDGQAFLEQVPFPECVNSNGEALGVEDAQRQRRLKQLGYR